MQSCFKVVNILMDYQLEWIWGDLSDLQIHLNICSNNEHIWEIEGLNRTIKERSRGIYNNIPFQKLPGQIIVYFISLVIFWLNALPPSPSIVRDLRPQHITTGIMVDYVKYCRLQFGEYAQVHETQDNVIQSHVAFSVAIRPTGNAQG